VVSNGGPEVVGIMLSDVLHNTVESGDSCPFGCGGVLHKSLRDITMQYKGASKIVKGVPVLTCSKCNDGWLDPVVDTVLRREYNLLVFFVNVFSVISRN